MNVFWNLYFKGRDVLKGEAGMGTIEVVLIIAVLIGLALIFRNQIGVYLSKIIESFNDVEIDPNTLPTN